MYLNIISYPVYADCPKSVDTTEYLFNNYGLLLLLIPIAKSHAIQVMTGIKFISYYYNM